MFWCLPNTWLFMQCVGHFYNTNISKINIDFFEPVKTTFRGKSLLEMWGSTFLPNWQPPLIFADLLQNHLSPTHSINAHAQEVWDKSDKD